MIHQGAFTPPTDAQDHVSTDLVGPVDSVDLTEKLLAKGTGLAFILGGAALAIAGIKSGDIYTAIAAVGSGAGLAATGVLVIGVDRTFNN